MEKTPTKVARYILGAFLILFGLNKFFHFIPTPEPTAESGAMLGALAQTGYFFPFVGAVETAVGAALLSGFFVPLALVVLAPISVNIFLLHLMLDPGGLGGPILISSLNAYLGFANIHKFQDILMPR